MSPDINPIDHVWKKLELESDSNTYCLLCSKKTEINYQLREVPVLYFKCVIENSMEVSTNIERIFMGAKL